MPEMTRYDDSSLLKIEFTYDTLVHVYASLSNIFVSNVILHNCILPIQYPRQPRELGLFL